MGGAVASLGRGFLDKILREYENKLDGVIKTAVTTQ